MKTEQQIRDEIARLKTLKENEQIRLTGALGTNDPVGIKIFTDLMNGYQSDIQTLKWVLGFPDDI